MATGLLSDWFEEQQRGLVMSIFNWGIYGGYGIAFPVGRYIPELNVWDLVSQLSLLLSFPLFVRVMISKVRQVIA